MCELAQNINKAQMLKDVKNYPKGGLNMDYREVYESWLNEPYFDEATKEELRAIANDDKEIKERFYMSLQFGTAGLRGIIGAGTNRMNIYVVRKTTQGLANYIVSQKGQDKGVVIAYDSRHMSPEFAMEAALTLAANGIKAYYFESLRPTPELSFALRTLGCIAGINITASHNPPEYNGYKVYWEDGAQITPPHDTGITNAVRAVEKWEEVKTMDKQAALDAGLLTIIGSEIDDKYNAVLKSYVLHQEAIDAEGDNLKIIYTPLHGTGNLPVQRILKELGFKHVFVVPEQEKPNGDFPTVSYPNPEAEEAFALGLKYAKEQDADLVLATDPDADRLGVRVKDSEGVYHTLTGNMSGCLIAEYELSQRIAVNGPLPADSKLVKTIVTTNLVDEMCRQYNVELIECLTGFKYIGQQILKMEETGVGHYQFGFEESYGCLPGTYARDKDAVIACMCLCEAAAYYKTQGKNLWDVMLDIYAKYGYFTDVVKSIEGKGIDGLAMIQNLMTSFRKNAPESFGGLKVLKVRDYKEDIIRDVATGETCPTGLPNSNVLYYELEDGAWLCVRPSGTEPKIKFYYGIKGDSLEDAAEKGKVLDKALDELVAKNS